MKLIAVLLFLTIPLSHSFQFFDNPWNWYAYQISENLIDAILCFIIFYLTPYKYIKFKTFSLILAAACFKSFISVVLLRFFDLRIFENGHILTISLSIIFIWLMCINLARKYTHHRDPINQNEWFYIIAVPDSVKSLTLSSLLIGLNLFKISIPIKGLCVYGGGSLYKYRDGRLVCEPSVGRFSSKYIVLNTGVQIDQHSRALLKDDNIQHWKWSCNCLNSLQKFGYIGDLMRKKNVDPPMEIIRR